MRLNTIQPAEGSKKSSKRLGRGIGSGRGKTAGHGHKGQRARAGGYHRVGFEGGQVPIQRRIPKSGFVSRKSLSRSELYLSDLEKLKESHITLEMLIKARAVPAHTKQVKIIASGTVTRAFTIQGLGISKGAREAILAAKGTVEV